MKPDIKALAHRLQMPEAKVRALLETKEPPKNKHLKELMAKVKKELTHK